jgi:hypothetical protein
MEGKRFISRGKEVLIKSVAQALPNYIMSIFKLTDGLCEDLMKAIRAFWWGLRKEGVRFSGSRGRLWFYPKPWEVWASRTSSCSTRPCWLNSRGV